ncbi:MAG: AP endonuclease [Bacteroidia bacterium]|nr:AP endonuclease [Bacteroidia bacterium]
MATKLNFIGLLALSLYLFACTIEKKTDNTMLFAKQNLVAWCIVPFDSVERTPEQRAVMLDELGITQLAYDWRSKHLSTFSDEIKSLQNHNIKLKAVWLWIENDSGEILDSANQVILNTLKNNEVKTDLWVGFGNSYFEGLTDEQKLEKGISAVRDLNEKAKEIGCKVNLYNHGDWFGEPENQIKIIEKSELKDIGIIYNFHHAHQQIENFPTLLQKMMPYLNTVNINGMKVDGPKILAIGGGDQELDMLKTLKSSGYNGTIGIIGHIETEDAKVVLKRNIDGLKSLLSVMGDHKAQATY